jgi:hypothetical protein
VQGLPVVAADQHDRVVDFLPAREQILRGFGPIEEIIADETRIFLRFAKDGDLWPVLERFAQSLRQHLAETVAKDRDEKAWRDGGLIGRLRDGFSARSLLGSGSHSFGRRIAWPWPSQMLSRRGPGEFRPWFCDVAWLLRPEQLLEPAKWVDLRKCGRAVCQTQHQCPRHQHRGHRIRPKPPREICLSKIFRHNSYYSTAQMRWMHTALNI